MSAALAFLLTATTALMPSAEVGIVMYPSGWPDGTLIVGPPDASGDPDGDGAIGVTLDPGAHLEFMAETTGPPIDGSPKVVVFVAPSIPSGPGALSLELLRCQDGACTPLAATSIGRSSWAEGDFTEIGAALPPTSVAPSAGAFLCLRVVNVGDQALTVAFGTRRHPASVWLPTGESQPAPTQPTVPPTPPSTSPDTDVMPDDRRDLLAGSIGLQTPAPTSPFPAMVSLAAMLMATGVAGVVLVMAAQPLRTRKLPARPARP